MQPIIDLRSDTVTLPTPDMRAAMANAKVGDDVYGEDPTVNHLQERAAELTGKQAGLFVASGTMGNLTAILTHCGRGDEVILGNQAHTYIYEAGGLAALGGVHPMVLPNLADGRLALEDIRQAVRAENVHFPTTRLIALENTHNRCGGAPLSVEYTHQVGELAKQYHLNIHLDGARLFNAAAALDVQPADLCANVDSVTFCLSKALCAPVGSVLCGSQDFIDRARRIRKQLGGGMRQAGVLAAAGLVALDTILPRLSEDHQQAQNLAAGLAKISGIHLDKIPPTNMVYLQLEEGFSWNAHQLAEKLKAMGVLVGAVAERRIRLVTHYWIDSAAVQRTLEAFGEITAKG